MLSPLPAPEHKYVCRHENLKRKIVRSFRSPCLVSFFFCSFLKQAPNVLQNVENILFYFFNSKSKIGGIWVDVEKLVNAPIKQKEKW